MLEEVWDMLLLNPNNGHIVFSCCLKGTSLSCGSGLLFLQYLKSFQSSKKD